MRKLSKRGKATVLVAVVMVGLLTVLGILETVSPSVELGWRDDIHMVVEYANN